MKAPDAWIPDYEDATTPSLQKEGVENIVTIVSEYEDNLPVESHDKP